MLWAVVAQVETLTKQRLPANHAVAAAVPPSIFLVPVDNKHEELSTNYSPNSTGAPHLSSLTRIFHELLAATTDMAVLPGVLGCRPLRRTVQARLGTNTLRLPGGTPIFVVAASNS